MRIHSCYIALYSRITVHSIDRSKLKEKMYTYSKFLQMKSSRRYFIFSFACYLIIWLMISPNIFEKKGILKIWPLVFLWGVKTNFGKLPQKWCIGIHEKKKDFQQYCPLIVIILTKCILYGICIMFLSFFGAITYSKDIFCFQESIFQWQISLISYRS